jgi:hypothetical protein
LQENTPPDTGDGQAASRMQARDVVQGHREAGHGLEVMRADEVNDL